MLKAYIEQREPSALFLRPGSRKTIDFHSALNFTIERNPSLLSTAEVALLLQAKSLRNAIEHYSLDFSEERIRSLCNDFLAVCVLMAQALLSISIADAFSWDYLRDMPDEVAHYLSSVLSQISELGRGSVRRAGESWAAENSSDPVFLCLDCGTRTVSRDRGICMGCGTEGDEDIVTMLEEFQSAERTIANLRRRLK